MEVTYRLWLYPLQAPVNVAKAQALRLPLQALRMLHHHPRHPNCPTHRMSDTYQPAVTVMLTPFIICNVTIILSTISQLHPLQPLCQQQFPMIRCNHNSTVCNGKEVLVSQAAVRLWLMELQHKEEVLDLNSPTTIYQACWIVHIMLVCHCQCR